MWETSISRLPHLGSNPQPGLVPQLGWDRRPFCAWEEALSHTSPGGGIFFFNRDIPKRHVTGHLGIGRPDKVTKSHLHPSPEHLVTRPALYLDFRSINSSLTPASAPGRSHSHPLVDGTPGPAGSQVGTPGSQRGGPALLPPRQRFRPRLKPIPRSVYKPNMGPQRLQGAFYTRR